MFQTCLNVFGSVDLLPLTGVTLPFVSNGGSAMMSAWGLLAFLKATDTRENASFAIRRGPQRQITAEVTKLPEAFSAAEADAITIAGACSYAVDKAALLTRPSALTAKADGPKVLIVHTHTSEAYTPEPGWEYESSDPLRTGDAEHSVVRLGTRVAELLNAHGIETLHDTALNDYPSYNGAYARMETTIEDWLAQYPSIQMVLDVHRDAALDYSGAQLAFTADVSGERCAQVMLVVGTDEGGLTHPDWEENLANALKLQALLNRSAPQLCRSIDLRTERFNAHTSPGALLAEFGAAGNTLPEAIRAGRYFAQGVAEFIQAAARTDA